MSRSTDIAKGISLLIGGIFLLLCALPFHPIGRVIFGFGDPFTRRHVTSGKVIPGNPAAVAAQVIIYLGIIISVAAFMITSGVALIREEDDKKDLNRARDGLDRACARARHENDENER